MSSDPWANPPPPQPRRSVIPCQGECEGANEATCNVVIGHDWKYGVCTARTKPMCHTCAVNERTEKEYGYADE